MTRDKLFSGYVDDSDSPYKPLKVVPKDTPLVPWKPEHREDDLQPANIVPKDSPLTAYGKDGKPLDGSNSAISTSTNRELGTGNQSFSSFELKPIVKEKEFDFGDVKVIKKSVTEFVSKDKIIKYPKPVIHNLYESIRKLNRSSSLSDSKGTPYIVAQNSEVFGPIQYKSINPKIFGMLSNFKILLKKNGDVSMWYRPYRERGSVRNQNQNNWNTAFHVNDPEKFSLFLRGLYSPGSYLRPLQAEGNAASDADFDEPISPGDAVENSRIYPGWFYGFSGESKIEIEIERLQFGVIGGDNLAPGKIIIGDPDSEHDNVIIDINFNLFSSAQEPISLSWKLLDWDAAVQSAANSDYHLFLTYFQHLSESIIAGEDHPLNHDTPVLWKCDDKIWNQLNRSDYHRDTIVFDNVRIQAGYGHKINITKFNIILNDHTILRHNCSSTPIELDHLTGYTYNENAHFDFGRLIKLYRLKHYTNINAIPRFDSIISLAAYEIGQSWSLRRPGYWPFNMIPGYPDYSHFSPEPKNWCSEFAVYICRKMDIGLFSDEWFAENNIDVNNIDGSAIYKYFSQRERFISYQTHPYFYLNGLVSGDLAKIKMTGHLCIFLDWSNCFNPYERVNKFKSLDGNLKNTVSNAIRSVGIPLSDPDELDIDWIEGVDEEFNFEDWPDGFGTQHMSFTSNSGVDDA